MSTLEQQLQDALHRQVDSGGASTPLDLAGVKGRARRIERRRRGAAVGLAAAVAAVLVPATLAVAPTFDRGSEAPVAPGPTPAPAPTPEHALAGDESMDFRDLPSGPAPSIGYLDLTGETPVVVSPGGGKTLLELEHDPFRYTRLADDRYVVLTRDEEGVWYVEVTDSAGTTQQVYPDTGGFAVDEEHAQVAWGNADGEVLVLAAGSERPRLLQDVGDGVESWVTDLDGTDCFGMIGMDFGCVARATTLRSDGQRGPDLTVTMDAATPTSGTSEEFFRHADSIRRGGPDTVEQVTYTAGVRELRDDGTLCSQVYGDGPDERESRVQLASCTLRFGHFSPDAGTLLALAAEGDGLETRIGMYDMAARELLWERSATTARMGQVALADWEDEEHLVASVFQGGEWQLVRFSRDGGVERIAGPVAGDLNDDLVPAFVPESQHSSQ